jgi:hypothetical protein
MAMKRGDAIHYENLPHEALHFTARLEHGLPNTQTNPFPFPSFPQPFSFKEKQIC